MAEPRYEITAVAAAPDGAGGFSEIVWNALCVDSRGVEHRHGKGYSLKRDTTWSPAAAALLATARDEAGVMAAVHADAARLLAEFEARVTGAAPVPMHFVFTDPPAPISDDVDPVSDPFPAP